MVVSNLLGLYGAMPDNGTIPDKGLIEFCGVDEFYPWINNRFGYCFREFIIGGIPALIILFGGSLRIMYILGLKRDIKLTKAQKGELGSSNTQNKRTFFWIKFIIGLIILISSQIDVINNAAVEDLTSPAIIVGDIIRAITWGISLVCMYLEYKIRLRPALSQRLFWIFSAIAGILQEYANIIEILQSNSPSTEWYQLSTMPSHISCLLQIFMAIFGIVGFIPGLNDRWEVIVNEHILKKREKGFSFKDLWRLIKPNWYIWLGALLSCILEGVLTIRYLEIVSEIVDLVEGKNEAKLWVSVGTFFGVACAAGICSFLQASLFGLAGYTMVQNIRNEMMKSLMIQEMAFFDVTSPGTLISILSSDTDKVGLIRAALPEIINPLSQCVYGSIVLFQTSWQLSAVVLALLVFELVEASIRSRQVSHKYSIKYTAANAEVADRGTEILSAITTVRLFVQEKKEKDSYAGFAGKAANVAKRKEVLEAIFEAIEYALYAGIIGVGVIYSYRLIEMNSLDKKGLTDFILIGVTMVTQFQDVIKAVPNVAAASGPATVLMRIINRKPLFNNSIGEKLDDLKGIIEFKDMTFKYPPKDPKFSLMTTEKSPEELEEEIKERSEQNNEDSSVQEREYIFRNFSLKIPQGSSCAFVGPSGCGKSTLFSLLLRSYDVSGGSIVIDEKNDLRSLNQKWWLRNVGVVTQEARLFKGTLRENILYGIEEKERAKIDNLEERIFDAVKNANLQKLVEDKTLDFQVGDRGSALSGGQKQRVCIARVFMKQPKILFLDEVTSALDPISESEVIKALEKLMVGRTTFVIAHRLHTLTNVDRIYVLKDGVINDQGNHVELLSHDGFYKTMWDKQQSEAARADMGGKGEYTVSKNDVNTLLDLLESYVQSGQDLPQAIVSMMRQIRPEKGDEVENDDSSDSDSPPPTKRESFSRRYSNQYNAGSGTDIERTSLLRDFGGQTTDDEII